MNRRDLLRAAPALPLLPLAGKLPGQALFGTLLADGAAEGGTLGVEVAAPWIALGSLTYPGTAADLTFAANAVLPHVERNWVVLEDCRTLSLRPVRDASLDESADLEWLPWGSPLAENTIVPGQYPRCGENVRDPSKTRQADEDW